MIRLLVVALLLTGCSPIEKFTTLRPVHHTTVYRYTSSADSCPKPESPDAELRRVTKSRDDWKRYAESLEKLLPADTTHGTHP